jgi:hypothetical protein
VLRPKQSSCCYCRNILVQLLLLLLLLQLMENCCTCVCSPVLYAQQLIRYCCPVSTSTCRRGTHSPGSRLAGYPPLPLVEAVSRTGPPLVQIRGKTVADIYWWWGPVSKNILQRGVGVQKCIADIWPILWAWPTGPPMEFLHSPVKRLLNFLR